MSDTINDKQSTADGGAVGKPAVSCCDAFLRMAPFFRWMTHDGGETLSMPYILDTDVDGTRWRVNYCPSCGKEVRNMDFPRALIHGS